MAAYVIAEIEITDPRGYEEYRALACAAVGAHGGRFVVRGGPAELLEGTAQPARIVMIEFPDADSARRWWTSPEYAPARVIRERTARTRMMVVDGVAP